MNINCSLRCIHQRNGKCHLKSLDANPTLIGYDSNGKECPYFNNTPENI
ncbi:MAG: hydroxymyristoyl-ACP dehydratase [Firmicutes bacterium]|nr:hydroxymyristoyl-ACP dehydratase [Bacillota bacterium]